MQRIIFTLVLIYSALPCSHICAQQDHWTVKAGESVQHVLGDSTIYLYPQFTKGIVRFTNGTTSGTPLNFNFVTGEMEFITPEKDTLAVANETTINYIAIQKDTFYFDKAYIKLVYANSSAKLGKVEIIRMTDVQKEGAFGQMSSTGSINTVNSFYGNETYKLSERSTVLLRRETIYFIGDKNNNFSLVSKKNLARMFDNKDSELDSFIKENKITFNKEPDLVELVDFLAKK